MALGKITHNRIMELSDKSNFKDSMNRWRTRSLFLETDYRKDAEALYTLKNEDYETKSPISGEMIVLPSFRRLYLETNDPTEYTIATQFLGGWPHWEALLDCKWFLEHLDLWRYELEIKLRSEAIRAIIEETAKGSRGRLNASKYIADGEYKGSKKGRPSKKELDAEKKKQADIRARLAGDAERLGLQLVDTETKAQ